MKVLPFPSRTFGVVILLGSLPLLVGCQTSTAPTPAYSFTPETGSGQADPNANQDGQEVIALVNDRPITMEAFQRELARFRAGQIALGLELTDGDGYEQQVLDLLVEYELIRQLAAREGIVISDEAVDAEINNMIQENGEGYFNSWLNSNYYSPEEFREVIRLDLMTDQLLEPIIASVPTVTEQVHARHILVNSQAEAEQVLARLRDGEDFSALAAEYSVDVTTRNNGGDLGWFPRGGLLVPEVEEAAFSLQVNQISGIISSAWGYHIVQTLEFDPARTVEEETRQRLLDKAIEEWRLSLRAGANIQQFVTLTS